MGFECSKRQTYMACQDPDPEAVATEPTPVEATKASKAGHKFGQTVTTSQTSAVYICLHLSTQFIVFFYTDLSLLSLLLPSFARDF